MTITERMIQALSREWRTMQGIGDEAGVGQIPGGDHRTRTTYTVFNRMAAEGTVEIDKSGRPYRYRLR